MSQEEPDFDGRLTVGRDPVGSVLIPMKAIRGGRYGALPVHVRFGGADLGDDCHAVVCADKGRWVSTRSDCLKKLVSWGLTETEADLLLHVGEAVARQAPPVDSAEEEGLYGEEIQKIRDGLLHCVADGSLKSKSAVFVRAQQACAVSSYGMDLRFIAVTIRYGLGHGGKSAKMARHIMLDDVLAKLRGEAAYARLP